MVFKEIELMGVVKLAKRPKYELRGRPEVREAMSKLENHWEQGEHVKGDAWVKVVNGGLEHQFINGLYVSCLLYTSDAADE